MRTSWRSTLALGLTVGGALLAAALALGLHSGAERWTTPAAWALAALVAAAALVTGHEAREAARLRHELALGLAHRIRTPLAHIRLHAELLLLGRERSEEERESWMYRIDQEAHRLEDASDNLLLFAQEPDAQGFPARRMTDLGALVEDVAAEYHVEATARGMHLHADPPPGVVALVDPRSMRHALVNLVLNALDHGSPGQTVVLTACAEAGRVVLAVSDEGPGISRRDRRRIWEPFVRLSSHGGEPGRGLGLPVVRHIARAHRGSAHLESLPGGGSRFSIVLPSQATLPGAPAREAAA